jgi:uncharacterized membrane protein (UPF0127 family)
MYIQTHINNHIFKTKVLTNNEEMQLGMIGKRFTSRFDALLFIVNKPSSAFWTKKCIVPLDIIFIENGKITQIHSNCPPCNTQKCPLYKGHGQLVIEMPGGTCQTLNIRKGNMVTFSKK